MLHECWFEKEKTPKWPHHLFCHCVLEDIPYNDVVTKSSSDSAYSKFDPYLFNPEGKYPHQKEKLFNSWGYTIDDAKWLQKEIEKQDKQMRDQALALIIKEAKKKVFDGWTDWCYDLLKCGICLCDEKSAKKLEKTLDRLLEDTQEDYFPEYKKEKDLIVRYHIHRHLYGKKHTKDELYQNISIDELRIIAIKDAMEGKNYDEAEKLCLEKANEEESWHYRSSDPEDWNNMLYDIYKTANNYKKKQV